jgi:S-adenosylmethionine decarboxylase
MLFEGTEKKLEVLLSPAAPSLRERGRAFWEDVVARSQAVILSCLENEYCDAYLLSESSLFVYDHRFIMITCGRTTLIDAALAVLDRESPAQLLSLIYERKNENFPGLQPSTFADDVKRLQERVAGTALVFGEKDSHHVSLFHLDRDCDPPAEDVTLEVLMYGLDPAAARMFRGPAAATRQGSGIGRVLEGFEIDDHAFDPAGYSLNALRGPDYYTVHVTPEEAGSYASFETNVAFAKAAEVRNTALRAVSIFRPERFDLMLFQSRADFRSLHPGYVLQSDEARRLGCGYNVQFCHFSRAASTAGERTGKQGDAP